MITLFHLSLSFMCEYKLELRQGHQSFLSAVPNNGRRSEGTYYHDVSYFVGAYAM